MFFTSNTEDPNRPVTDYPAAPNPHPNGYSAHPQPAGAAYPFAADPPPSNAYYPENYEYDPDCARCETCFRCIFAFVVGLVIIFGTVIIIATLVLRPQYPEFRVDSFSISNFTLGNNSLVSFTSQIRLTMRNPNKKMRLEYDHIKAVIFYKSESLSETTAATPFSQGTKNETSLTANFVAAWSFVDRLVGDEINSEWGNNGNVNFNLRLLSTVRFEAKAWRTGRRSLKVFCGHLIVGIPSDGRSGELNGGPQQCFEPILR